MVDNEHRGPVQTAGSAGASVDRSAKLFAPKDEISDVYGLAPEEDAQVAPAEQEVRHRQQQERDAHRWALRLQHGERADQGARQGRMGDRSRPAGPGCPWPGWISFFAWTGSQRYLCSWCWAWA